MLKYVVGAITPFILSFALSPLISSNEKTPKQELSSKNAMMEPVENSKEKITMVDPSPVLPVESNLGFSDENQSYCDHDSDNEGFENYNRESIMQKADLMNEIKKPEGNADTSISESEWDFLPSDDDDASDKDDYVSSTPDIIKQEEGTNSEVHKQDENKKDTISNNDESISPAIEFMDESLTNVSAAPLVNNKDSVSKSDELLTAESLDIIIQLPPVDTSLTDSHNLSLTNLHDQKESETTASKYGENSSHPSQKLKAANNTEDQINQPKDTERDKTKNGKDTTSIASNANNERKKALENLRISTIFMREKSNYDSDTIDDLISHVESNLTFISDEMKKIFADSETRCGERLNIASLIENDFTDLIGDLKSLKSIHHRYFNDETTYIRVCLTLQKLRIFATTGEKILHDLEDSVSHSNESIRSMKLFFKTVKEQSKKFQSTPSVSFLSKGVRRLIDKDVKRKNMIYQIVEVIETMKLELNEDYPENDPAADDIRRLSNINSAILNNRFSLNVAKLSTMLLERQKNHLDLFLNDAYDFFYFEPSLDKASGAVNIKWVKRMLGIVQNLYRLTESLGLTHSEQFLKDIKNMETTIKDLKTQAERITYKRTIELEEMCDCINELKTDIHNFLKNYSNWPFLCNTVYYIMNNVLMKFFHDLVAINTSCKHKIESLEAPQSSV